MNHPKLLNQHAKHSILDETQWSKIIHLTIPELCGGFILASLCMWSSYFLYNSLHQNDLTSTGVIALARALQQNKSLEELK